MSLNLLEYWDKRATYYTDIKYEEKTSYSLLKSYIDQAKPKSLIEIGCATGILFPLYKNVPEAAACDWSSQMLERARLRCERCGLKVKLFKLDIANQVPEGCWQLSVARFCLMHIPPERIKNAVNNIIQVCDEAFIYEYWEPSPSISLSAHNWLHDYRSLFEEAGFTALKFHVMPDKPPQALFLFTARDRK